MAVTTIPESHLDLAEAPGVVVLSTVGTDGLPQSTAIWYLLDDGVFKTSLHTSRQKYKNLVANPKATLFFLDPTNPFHTLEVRADVELTDDPGEVFFERVVRHYGQDPATFPADRAPRVIVTFVPRRVVAQG
jgi:PPOX class probable F420-dependent enzyme